MRSRLSDTRVWLVGGALLALVIAAVGWTVFIGPQLSTTRDLRDQTVETQRANDLLQVKARSLEDKSTRMGQLTASLRAAEAALPSGSGLPDFTRQINAQATAAGVVITSVVVGAPAPVAGATPASAVDGGLFSMPVTLESRGALSDQIAFLGAVRTGGARRVLISSLQVSPGVGAKGASISGESRLSTRLEIFSAPQTPAQTRQLKKLLSGDLGS
jgi:Tfp pilus assembly protein PilO